MTRRSAVRDPWLRRIGIALVAPVAVVACSIPITDNVDRIDTDRLGALANTTTTTPPTTTAAPTTLEPPASTDAPVTTPATSAPTTTTPLVTLVTPVNIYYTVGNTETMQFLRRELPGPSLQQVALELESPVPNLSALNLQTSVRVGLIAGLSLARGTLDVAVDRTIFDAMSDPQKRRAIAQIVLTFTSFATADAGAVAFVRLLYADDGTAISVPLPTGEPTEPGAPLNFEDFRVLIAATPGATTTVAPTTAPETDPSATPTTEA